MTMLQNGPLNLTIAVRWVLLMASIYWTPAIHALKNFN